MGRQKDDETDKQGNTKAKTQREKETKQTHKQRQIDKERD